MNTEGTKQTPPSKEEVLKFYKEQIEVAQQRKTLSLLNAEIAEYEARRIEAIAKAAHFTQPQRSPQPGDDSLPPGVVEHIITQEDLDNNPELIDEGLKVGDRIGIAQQADPAPTPTEDTPVKKERKLRKVEN